MANVRGNSGGTTDVVWERREERTTWCQHAKNGGATSTLALTEGELSDVGVELEEKGEGLSDSSCMEERREMISLRISRYSGDIRRSAKAARRPVTSDEQRGQS